MSNRVVGLDVSLTSTGVAGRDFTARIPSVAPKTDKMSLYMRSVRMDNIVRSIFGLLQEHDLVVIEQPSFASKGGSMWDRAGLWWKIVDELLVGTYDVVEVPPSTMKKYITGKGNAGKDDVIRCVAQLFPGFAGGNDEADAMALCAMGYDYLGEPLVKLPAAQRKALEAVRWDG